LPELIRKLDSLAWSAPRRRIETSSATGDRTSGSAALDFDENGRMFVVAGTGERRDIPG
jgi:hypothetical protein